MAQQADIKAHRAPMAWRPVPRRPLTDAVAEEVESVAQAHRDPEFARITGAHPDSGPARSQAAFQKELQESAR